MSTPNKLFKKWNERLENTDEESIAHKLITEFVTDIGWIEMEPTEEEIENRKLISFVADQIKRDIKAGRMPPIDLSDEE